LKHIEKAVSAVDIPIILYDVPSRTGLTIGIDTYRELSKHPNINGTKEACGSLSHIAKIFFNCGDDMNVWSGEDDQVIPMMSLGGKGVISVVANIMPREVAEMCGYALAGNFKEAGRRQIELLDVCNDMFIEVNPIPVKTALNLIGMNGGNLRLPLCEMEPANFEKMKATLKKHGLI
jgi:4-hydroxy-tetrahydrodipicolinate synthase